MDYIFYNGTVLTMDAVNSEVEAVAIKGNKIYKVGSNESIISTKTEKTILIDLKGRCLLPGFNDSHMHLINFAYTSEMIPLHNCSSIKEIILIAGESIKNDNDQEGWIQGRGWQQAHFEEKRMLTKVDLDRISEERPIIFTRACGHVAVLNSKALEVIGINRNSAQPEGGHFDIDEKGEPTGILREHAIDRVYANMKDPDIEGIKYLIKQACQKALEKGITSIQTDDLQTFSEGSYKLVIQAYEELIDEEKLPIRIYQQCLIQNINDFKSFVEEGYLTGAGNENFKIGPLKLLADGSLGARTAKLIKPYSDDPNTTGIQILSQSELNELIDYAAEVGMQVAVHCIGDQTLACTLASFERALSAHPNPDHRHGIVHCQITNRGLLEKMVEWQVMAYIQPIFLQSDIAIVNDRIGIERAEESYAFKTMMTMGIKTPYSSDSPVETFDVMKGLHCAVNRQDMEENPPGGWYPKEKVSVLEALRNYTIEGAYASFEEEIKGSIEEGKLADLIILKRNPLTASKNEIKDISVELTMINGKIEFENK